MNSKAKGSRNERRSRALLEAAGYQVTRSGGSLGAFDLVGIGPSDVVLVQVKSNRQPGPRERHTLAAIPCPANARKLVHVWRDRQALPDVQELPGVEGRCSVKSPARGDGVAGAVLKRRPVDGNA